MTEVVEHQSTISFIKSAANQKINNYELFNQYQKIWRWKSRATIWIVLKHQHCIVQSFYLFQNLKFIIKIMIYWFDNYPLNFSIIKDHKSKKTYIPYRISNQILWNWENFTFKIEESTHNIKVDDEVFTVTEGLYDLVIKSRSENYTENVLKHYKKSGKNKCLIDETIMQSSKLKEEQVINIKTLLEIFKRINIIREV